ncbi:MAG: hypothetical protein ACE5I1_13455, partial [bacterium]
NRIFNNFELAQSQYIFEKAVEVRTYYFEFTGIISPQLLSKPINFSLIDLKQANASFVDKTVIVRVSREGILNSIRLTSPIEIHDDIHFLSSDSLMPPVIIPLEEDLKVEEYDLVKIRIQYCCPSDWKQVKCEAWRVNGAY